MAADDLLTPTLSAKDDTDSLSAPWNPLHLALATFFGGPFTGGILFGLNYRRLGEDRKALPAFLGFGILGVLLVASLLFFVGEGGLLELEDQARRDHRLLSRVVYVLAAALAAWSQRRRYALFTHHGGSSPRVWPQALGAVAVGWFGTMVLGLLLVLLVR